MSRVFFRAGPTTLEVTGAEPFVNRQLVRLAEHLPYVDPSALEGALETRGFAVAEPAAPVRPPAPAEDAPAAPVRETSPSPASAVPAPAPEPAPESDLVSFFRENEPGGRDRQAESALLFAYFLQHREGVRALELGDLLRCCARVGVDTRNFNRTLGRLTRRGLFETVRHGHAYRLSPHGLAAVEQQIA